MSQRHELRLPDGRVFVVHDTGPAPGDAPALVWHHGSPQSGALLQPVLDAAHDRGMRVVSCARHEETAEFDASSFTPADHAMFDGPWGALGADAAAAGDAWPEGLVDDDVAFVRPWGVALSDVACPVLVVQGDEDRVVPRHHADLLVRVLPRGEAWVAAAQGARRRAGGAARGPRPAARQAADGLTRARKSPRAAG